MLGRMSRALKPEAQGFDEVRIVTSPRYKESELSGDEWRISATIQFFRKGKEVFTAGARNIESAVAQVGYYHARGLDEGRGFFAGEDQLCDQEGCAEPATVAYRLKKGFNRDGNERHLSSGGEYRCFCNRHKTRGDCGLEEADNNYEATEFPRGAD